MARTGMFHHVGTFLLLAATVLLIITTITAPVLDKWAILKVRITDTSVSQHHSVAFGTFGFCVYDPAEGADVDTYCNKTAIGYNPAQLMAEFDRTDFSSANENTSKALTRVMILHPVACVLAFIAFCLSLGSGFIGALFAAFVAALAWLVTLVVMVTDFVSFGLIKNRVNKDDSGSHAYYTTGMWTILAAMVCLFLATIIVLLTCCSARRHKNDRVVKHEAGYANGTTTTKRRFWQRRSRTTRY